MLQDNPASQLGPAGIFTASVNANSTAGLRCKLSLKPGRGAYYDVSPYCQDDWKATPKLTLNLGLRWDSFPPFYEVLDRWSFLNPNLTNALTGDAGELQFAGTAVRA